MSPTSAVGIADLYPSVDRQLRRILGRNLRVPDWVLDDACQMAWETLLARPEAVEHSRLLGWLATTARREALAILRRSRNELGLDAVGIDGEGPAEPALDPQQSIEFWDRLGQIRRLPRRQQRIVWMQSLGFDYGEIAAQTGESRRTVDRQLTAARRRLKAAA